jgi:hypothetical protein
MHQVSSALNLRDNDALWSIIAVLEYYARLYEAMPERVRWASEGSLEAARREVGGATDALMQQHRDALERCKATIQLAESLIQEHEARYRAALAQLNETAMMALTERMSNQVARTAGNRLIGVPQQFRLVSNASDWTSRCPRSGRRLRQRRRARRQWPHVWKSVLHARYVACCWWVVPSSACCWFLAV